MKNILFAISTAFICSGLFAQNYNHGVSTGNGHAQNYQQASVTTYTSVSTNSNHGQNHQNYYGNNNHHNHNNYGNHNQGNVHYGNSYGARYPMSDYDFNDACRYISTKSFDDSKLQYAKQISRSGCLTAEQVRDINRLFSFEQTRLDFAKFAYDYVYNPAQYYKVSESFNFDSSIDELYEYIDRGYDRNNQGYYHN